MVRSTLARWVAGSSIPIQAKQAHSASNKVWETTVRIPQLKLNDGPACPVIDHLDEATTAVTRLLKEAQGKTLVITGAGASTDSGIPDYRGDQGTYVKNPKHRPILYHELASSKSFRQRYWARGFLGWPEMSRAQPNPTHHILAQLMDEGHIQHLITQNVDGLHGMATPLHHQNNIVELHGTLYRVECLQCGSSAPREQYQHRLLARNPSWQKFLSESHTINPDGDVQLPAHLSVAQFDIPPCTSCGSRDMKPEVVFFGENIRQSITANAEAMVRQARAVLVIGSSLATFSSFRLVRQAKQMGLPIGIICKGRTRADTLAAWRVHLNCTEVLQNCMRSPL